ncbi:MAG TPA: DUF1656 domain-containing protein [Dyella sp.]|uniref:DUF1656 domain-containing protein n=1 Tax=Dyella sp. TaxID=1869338 RepID=UPI002F93C5FF
MPREIAIGGALIPGLLPIFLGCAVLLWSIDFIVGRFDLYRYVWHPPLFRVALFVCLFGAAGLLLLP